MLHRRWFRWILLFAGWSCIGLFFASQTYVTYKFSGGAAPVAVILKFSLAEWYVWALLAPGVLWLARRFPIERGWWGRNLPVHLVAGVAVASLKWYFDNLVRNYVLGFRGSESLAFKFHVNLMTYWMIVGAAHGYDFYRRYREGELRAAQLSAQLAQAQLQALRVQLHPHFLFNTLNGIAALVHKDAEAADRMIARLSELLRLSLQNIGVQEVALAQELEFLEKYLEIERIRFADRLDIRMEIAPETLSARTPYLILQPLVENAIRHGIAPRSAPGRIVVHAEREDDMLVLEVRDDGPGLPAGAAGRGGVGISSTRARLERVYGPRHQFELRNAEGGGVIAFLSFPFDTVPANTAKNQLNGVPA